MDLTTLLGTPIFSGMPLDTTQIETQIEKEEVFDFSYDDEEETATPEPEEQKETEKVIQQDEPKVSEAPISESKEVSLELSAQAEQESKKGKAKEKAYSFKKAEEPEEQTDEVPGCLSLEDLDYTNPEEKWSIKDDKAADWAVKKIKEEFAEYERIKSLADAQIAELKEKLETEERRYENNTKYLRYKLQEYFQKVPKKVAKTKESYRLLNGSLVLKKGTLEYQRDEELLVSYLKETNQFKYLKESSTWGDFKKNLEIVDGKVIDKTTGEVLEFIKVSEKPDKFEVDFK